MCVCVCVCVCVYIYMWKCIVCAAQAKLRKSRLKPIICNPCVKP